MGMRESTSTLAFFREFWHVYAILVFLLFCIAVGINIEAAGREKMRAQCERQNGILYGDRCVVFDGATVRKVPLDVGP